MVKLEGGTQDPGPPLMQLEWYVEVPPVPQNWRRRSLQQVEKTLRVKKARLNFPQRAPKDANSAAASQLSESLPIVEVPSTDSLGLQRPFKRVRLGSENLTTPVSPQSTSQDTTPRPPPPTRRNRNSPSRPLNPFKPYFSIPFAEESYPPDAEASLQQEPQHRCSAHFGSQTWSPSLRVAASSEGYRCQWMTKQRTIFFPQGECCGKTFISAELLMRHLFKSHVQLVSQAYACRWDTCANRAYHSMAAIEEHMQKHLAPYGWSCPFQECKLSSSRPINRKTHDQHVEKAHDTLWEQLRPLALPRPVKETLASTDPPPTLPEKYLRSWQLSIPVPRTAKHRAPRLAPWQMQQPSIASGGLVGVAPREDIRTTGAAPWSDIVPLLDHLEPHAEPVNASWPSQEQASGWSVDLSTDDPDLAQERWKTGDDAGKDPDHEFDAVPEERQSEEDLSGDRKGSGTAGSHHDGDARNAGTWTPPSPFPPIRRRAATASLPPDGLRRDASTQTDGTLLYATPDNDPRERLPSMSAVPGRTGSSITPPPTYHEATSHQRNAILTPKRVERAVQMTHSC